MTSQQQLFILMCKNNYLIIMRKLFIYYLVTTIAHKLK